MNVLSLFDGISCGQLALERANIKVDKYFACEIKKTAIKVTQNHFPKTIQLGDVTKLNTSNLPKIDLLIAGSPCQDLSSANIKQEGLKGKKSNLFYEFVRILQEVKPKYFLLENVASMKKQDKDIITNLLKTEPIEINSSLVSYQNRKRLYWTNIPNINLPKDKNISFQTYKCVDENKCKKNKLTKTKSRLKMWGSGSNGNCLNVTHSEKINCITTSQDRWNNSGLVQYEDFCRYLTIEELELAQTLPLGYTFMLTKRQAWNVIGDGWTVDVIAHIFSNLKEKQYTIFDYMKEVS